ncbi:MAG: thioredoxin family protein [Myxococcales bacterium]|nr:thioredoxin family protein [Myxococcales bacterium]
MSTRVTLSLLAVVALACTSAEPVPRSPHWNKDGCAHCRMAISDPAAAAQLVGSGGLIRHYDDLGCLLANRVAHPELAEPFHVRALPTTAFVMDGQIMDVAVGAMDGARLTKKVEWLLSKSRGESWWTRLTGKKAAEA